MSDFEIKESWNGKQPKRDPDAEYLENLIYIMYRENKLEVYFESVKLVHGFLKNKHAEIGEVHYHNDQPIAVKGYLPLGCLRIKGEKRKHPKIVI
ncbi:MAG: hypothetical protein ACLFVB_03470 [Thermoplasmata archaeon]